MDVIENLLKEPPFSIDKSKKVNIYNKYFAELTNHHYMHCLNYKRILDILDANPSSNDCKKIPPIPVRLFKDYNLKSIDDKEVIKTMTSSGTSGQQVSKIFLDRYTATNQTKVLAKILSEFLGNKRLPMLIIDTKEILKDRLNFSARAAGILGFRTFGRNVTFALNSDMSINYDLVKSFLKENQQSDILIFGFTSIIWEHFFKNLKKNPKHELFISKGILIHGGGWKKLESESVDNETFKRELLDTCGISKIHNYYGMIEQTGSIFMECEEGFMHCSNFSDIEILNNRLEVIKENEKGIVKLYSLLPFSYPGHIILTEDEGQIFGEDNCKCGRLGKYFKIYGRIKNAEIRGCSDTYKS